MDTLQKEYAHRVQHNLINEKLGNTNSGQTDVYVIMITE